MTFVYVHKPHIHMLFEVIRLDLNGLSIHFVNSGLGYDKKVIR